MLVPALRSVTLFVRWEVVVSHLQLDLFAVFCGA
jgi:hypothetical protein